MVTETLGIMSVCGRMVSAYMQRPLMANGDRNFGHHVGLWPDSVCLHAEAAYG